jgi:hypothetical protein
MTLPEALATMRLPRVAGRTAFTRMRQYSAHYHTIADVVLISGG